MKITIDTHNCSREELAELKRYLEDGCWDIESVEDEEEVEAKFILSEDGILIVGSHGITLNDKIRDEELHEYYIEERTELIDKLIGWIAECNRDRESSKVMMQQDLEMLIGRDETYLFSSNATNSYIFPSDSDFNKTCEELIDLNKGL